MSFAHGLFQDRCPRAAQPVVGKITRATGGAQWFGGTSVQGTAVAVRNSYRPHDDTDDSHVKRTTALETKMRQMKAASELGIDPQHEASTSRTRANKEIKPI